MPPPDEAAMLAAFKKSSEDGFKAWFDRPEIKLIVSILPPMTTDLQRDCFRTLLETAYRDGHNQGQGSIAGRIMQGMLDERRR